MSPRFRLIKERRKIIRMRVDKIANAYKKTSMRKASVAERRAEARRRVHRGAKHVRPLCNICEGKVHKVTIDRGKKIAEEANIPRFYLIGYWCDNCLHFFKTKTRRVIVEKRVEGGSA